ncbi:PAS domain-containing sensor histidine kinase [Rhizobiales bacterium TNE-4]|nr:PAS domain-containing sensor histidine kinase [Rhizobiales bacterium TNE-4]MBV1826557.1 PAS domain-containing sensor histidine kinase [Rhizobiales bacterium TNE-4]
MRRTVETMAGNGQGAERYFVLSRLVLAAAALAAVPVLLIADLGFAPQQGLILAAFGSQIVPALLVQNGWKVPEGQTLSVAILLAVALLIAVLINPGFALVPLLTMPFIVLEMLYLQARPKQEPSAQTAPREQAMLAAIDALVLEHDGDGEVTGTNSTGETILGVHTDALIGRTFFERVHVADRPAYLRHCDEAARGHQPEPLDLRIRCGADHATPLYQNFTLVARPLVPNEDRGPFIAIVRRAEQAAAAAPTEEAVQDRILAVMTHELRTPLNAIIGFADLLASDLRVLQDDERRRDYARIIRLSGEHLLDVVNTVLDASKLQAGALQPEPEGFDFAPLLDETIAIMQLKAEKSGVTLLPMMAGQHIHLIADKRALRQILLNLLSNAVKFSPQGGDVTVRARCEGTEFILSVEDCGVGIASRDLARIGEPFFQAHGGTARAFEGTGLGLSVVRGLVALHGGTMTIDSEQGKGTCVTIRMNRDIRRVLTRVGTCTGEAQGDIINAAHSAGVKKIA